MSGQADYLLRIAARDVMLALIRKEASPERSAPYLQRIYEPVETLIERGQQRGVSKSRAADQSRPTPGRCVCPKSSLRLPRFPVS